MKKNKIKVLIISLQGFGNTILSLPAIIRYAESNSVYITMVVCKSGFVDILERFDFVKKIYLWDENKSFFINVRNLRKKLRNVYFDIAFATVPNGRRENALLFFANSKIKRSYRYDRAFFRMLYFLNSDSPKIESSWHDAVGNMKLFDIDTIPKSIDLNSLISDRERKYARKLINGDNSTIYITLHPGSVDGAKDYRRWPEEYYIELCNRLIENYNCRFVLIGGKTELAIIKKIGRRIKNNPIVLQNETLPQTLAIMRETDFFLGNDSGPAHLASTVDIPMLVIWGCGDYNLTSHLSSKCLILRKNYPGSPCYDFTKSTPSKCQSDFYCIEKIKIDEVYDIIKNRLDAILYNRKTFDPNIFSTIKSIDSLMRLNNGPLLINLKPD